MKKITTLFFLGVLGFLNPLLACTGLLITAKDGSIVTGRTVEFGVPIEMTVAVVPRGLNFVGKTPSGDGLKYQSKYAAVGAYCFDEQVLMDGMNEKGLVAASFYFPGYASYASINDSNQNQALSPVEFPHWILTQFATVDEVKAGLQSVVIAPTVSKAWGSVPAPFHYIVYDKTGKSIVIEPLNGSLVVYDNPIGVMTNSPTFDWHLTHLRSFINLTPVNKAPITLRGLELAPFGQGSGLVGLPGDFTPPSRFVRASIFSCSAIPVERSEASVYQTFHILNQFDIPYGVARQNGGGATHYDYTMATTVKDPQTLKYYYKSYEDQTIYHVDLNQFDLKAKKIKKLKLGKKNQESINASKMLN